MTEHTILIWLGLGILASLGASVYLVWRNFRRSRVDIHHLTYSSYEQMRQELTDVRARLEATLLTSEQLSTTLARLELLRQDTPPPSLPPEGTQR